MRKPAVHKAAADQLAVHQPAGPPLHFWQHPEFIQGARDMLPVAPGIAAWGLMTGVAMMKSGLSLVESLSMALMVFAGSSQLAAMPLIVAGAPMWVILATGFCVNLRFVVFSLHLRPYMMHLPLWRRLLGGYLTADLSYVMFTRRHPQPADALENTTKSIANSSIKTGASSQNEAQKGSITATRDAQQAYLLGNCLVNWLSWVLPCTAGVLLAQSIPQHWGLSFAGILALLGIGCSLASSQLRVVSALIAGAAAVAAFALPLRLNILVAIAVAVVLCLSLERFRPALQKAPS